MHKSLEPGRAVREFTVTTTQRNQVTIPAEVRRILGLKPRDKVAFTIEDGGEVRLSAASLNLESAYGSVNPSATREDFDAISRNAKDAKVESELGSYKLAKGAVPWKPGDMLRRKPSAE